MGNIKNFNFNKVELRLSNSDYWDLFLSTDDGPTLTCTGLTSGDCFVVWYDFNNPNIYPNSATSATSIYSLVTWNDAINTGYTINTIGLTGIDNGLITFDTISGDTSNQVLLSALTGSTLVIPSGDTRLTMTRVTGETGNFIYPIYHIVDTTSVGDYKKFCGGFYQGYYKLDGNTYEVLPVRVPHSWSAEFWIQPTTSSCSDTTGTTLNDVYPNNKGIFFYMGTRAENKFWNEFTGADTGCTSGCTQPSGCTGVTRSQWCTIPKENEISIIGDYGIPIPLDPPQIEIDVIYNQFLIYGRAYDARPEYLTGNSGTILYSTASTFNYDSNQICHVCGGASHSGLGTQTACSYDGNGIVVVRTAQHTTNNINPFLVYGRGRGAILTGDTCCQGPGDGLGSQTVWSFSGFTSPTTEINYNLDIIDNALAFIIKDDGSIGYRLLTITGHCLTATTGTTYISGTTIKEEYSISGMVSADTWSYIAIKFVTNYLDGCDLITAKPRTGKLMFYVNARLKFVVNDFPEFVARRLHEYKAKQVGVPFNFSLGGGSQGLIESMTFDGLDMSDRGLPIETNFGGSFIGFISQFKFNICDLAFCDIKYNYMMDAPRYGNITTIN